MRLAHGSRLGEARHSPRSHDERIDAMHDQDSEQERYDSECRFAERGLPAD